jgi:hypothetical protein
LRVYGSRSLSGLKWSARKSSAIGHDGALLMYASGRTVVCRERRRPARSTAVGAVSLVVSADSKTSHRCANWAPSVMRGSRSPMKTPARSFLSAEGTGPTVPRRCAKSLARLPFRYQGEIESPFQKPSPFASGVSVRRTA